jgi:hypothetical protein
MGRRSTTGTVARCPDACSRPSRAVFVLFVQLVESAANPLTNVTVDPASKLPEYPVGAGRMEGEDV